MLLQELSHMSAGDKRRMEQEALKITPGSLKGFLFGAL